VLEALRIYAGNAQRELLEQIAAGHDEKYRQGKNEQIEYDIQLPFENFFFGRQFPQDETLAISIGELASADDVLRIEHGFILEEEKVLEADSGEIVSRSRRRVLEDSFDELSPEMIRHVLFVTKVSV
jgi:hypothetical protein